MFFEGFLCSLVLSHTHFITMQRMPNQILAQKKKALWGSGGEPHYNLHI
jgi:hypothetical protein